MGKLDKTPSDLGKAVDERIRVGIDNTVRSSGASPAPAVPLSSGGGSPGSSGGDGDPVVPEDCVLSLRAQGQTELLTGNVVVEGQGDTSISQSTGQSKLLVSVPAYTGGEGVERIGNEFRCDGTVVRTQGDQQIQGTKSFGAFPLTPADSPTDQLQVVNKKYVDESLRSIQSFSCGQGINGSSIPGVFMTSAAFPETANSTNITKISEGAFVMYTSNQCAVLGNCYLRFHWTSSSEALTGQLTGMQAAIGVPVSNLGSLVNIQARMRVNDPDRFSAVYLGINDSSTGTINSLSSPNVLNSLTSDTWATLDLANVDVSAWTGPLRLVLTVQGTGNAANAGYTQVDVEHLSIEQVID